MAGLLVVTCGVAIAVRGPQPEVPAAVVRPAAPRAPARQLPGRVGGGRTRLDEPPGVPNPVEPIPKWSLITEAEDGQLEDPYKTWQTRDWVMRTPAEFPDVPDAIRAELESRGCRIPQWLPSLSPENLVWGEFEHRGQKDLIVLCVTKQSVRSYIFWAGEVARIEVLPFGRRGGASLGIASAEAVDVHAAPDAVLTDEMPARVEHDVIEVGCCECCSTYYYRYQGKWFAAAGAD